MYENYNKFYDEISRCYFKYLHNDEEYKKIISSGRGALDNLDNYKLFIDELLNICCHKHSEPKFIDKLDTTKTVIYRGIHGMSKRKYLKKLKDKSFTFYRWGILGYGSYYSTDLDLAMYYAKDKRKNVIEANIENFDNSVYIDKLEIMKKDFLGQVEFYDKADKAVLEFIKEFKHYDEFITALAGSNGYDAIITGAKQGVCVINPECISIVENVK